MILREYLYVDISTVRGILAQLDSGITESMSETSTSDKKTGGGAKGILQHTRTWGDSVSSQKSLVDALFPNLELLLEAEEMLEDISVMVNTADAWRDDNMRNTLRPGKIIRISGPGYLMDARFVAAILSGFTVTSRGLVNVNDSPQSTQHQKSKGHGKGRYQELPDEGDELEGKIPLTGVDFGDGSETISGPFLRGIVQVTRGMFTPGLHLSISPDIEGAGTISVRLQEGRQYLDTDPDILFARYGVGAQEWTVVGTIGHHPLPNPNMDSIDFVNKDGSIGRAKSAASSISLLQ